MARTPVPQPARAETTERAQEAPAAPAATRAPVAGGEQATARAIFDRMVAANPVEKPDAARIHEEADLTCNRATSRRWVQNWWNEVQADLGTARPELPDAEPAEAKTDESAVA